MYSSGKSHFSQMRPAIDKVIFLPFTGKLKLFFHHCLGIRLILVGGKLFSLGGKPGGFVLLYVGALMPISSKPRKSD